MGRPLPPPFWDDLDAVEPLIYFLPSSSFSLINCSTDFP